MSKPLSSKNDSPKISLVSFHTAVLFLPIALTLVLSVCIYSPLARNKPPTQGHQSKAEAIHANNPPSRTNQASRTLRPTATSENNFDRDPTWRRTPRGWQQLDEPSMVEQTRFEKNGEVTRWSNNPTVAVLQSAWPPAAAVFIAFASYSLLNSWPTNSLPSAPFA